MERNWSRGYGRAEAFKENIPPSVTININNRDPSPEIPAPPPSPEPSTVDPEAEWAAMNHPPNVREMGPGRRQTFLVDDAFVNEIRTSLRARRAAVHQAIAVLDQRQDNAATEEERAACEKEKQDLLLPAISGLERLLVLVAREAFVQDMFDAYDAVAATVHESTDHLVDVSNSPTTSDAYEASEAYDASGEFETREAYWEYLTGTADIDEAERSFDRLVRGISEVVRMDGGAA
ncbi:hypothetical protein R3P38DRAFT_2774906 [Favolaschia claudopus]|uniref:Uncharacterized protein n=1 Tax=Favolaschia claudopus TaxID=2862362 RepID=A0AAW0BUV0_9AGAR